MESRRQDDQGHRQVTGQQNLARKDCQEDHASQEKAQSVKRFLAKRVFPFFWGHKEDRALLMQLHSPPPRSQSKKKTLHSRRDAQSYPLHRLDLVHERPKPKYLLRDLVKLWQETKQKEQEADRRTEQWHRACDSLKQDYLALKDRDLCLSCQWVKDETEEGETVKQCHECSTGRETRKSRELKLDMVYQDLRYWQECYETLLSKQRERKKKPKHTHHSWNNFSRLLQGNHLFNFFCFFWSTNDQAPVPEATPRRLECAIEKLNRYKHG